VCSSSKLHLGPSTAINERAQLCCSFQAPTLRLAAGLAAELGMIDAHVPRIRSARTPASDRGNWIVTVTTPEIPLTLTVLRRWEEELLTVQQRWPGCRFLGWKTYGAPPARRSSADAGREQNAA